MKELEEGAGQVGHWYRAHQACPEPQKQAPTSHENRGGGACLQFQLSEGGGASGGGSYYSELHAEVSSKPGLQ